MGEGLPDVSSSPVVVYAAMAVVLVLALATITDRGLGPISRAWYAFARNRRQAAADRRSADYAELDRQVKNLARQLADQRIEHANDIAQQDREIAAMRDELRKRDLCAIDHQRWDRQILAEVTRLGGQVPDQPPPLWPTDTA